MPLPPSLFPLVTANLFFISARNSPLKEYSFAIAAVALKSLTQ